jgi:hypothetical protein
MQDPNRIIVCEWGKDGGPESRVWGFWLLRWKRVCTIALLKFEPGSRDAYHSHAFNSTSWLLRGELVEKHLGGDVQVHRPSLRPIRTFRDTFHKVFSRGTSWVLTFRGPWADTWQEYVPNVGRITLTHGRRCVG